MTPGTHLGPYEIVEQLGAGGMGEVWLAQDTRLHRRVAVKVLPAEFASDPERLARFEQEARAAAALNHPHIAAVYDVGHEEGVHFLVQELLEGESLGDRLAAGPLSRSRALTLAAEIAEGLAAAHRAGIVHRDLKPDNIFVSPDGHAKILDFGLAKLTELGAAGARDSTESPTVLATLAGTVMGTAGYMAPEQVTGREVDRRADLFALGCVLYEMLLGERAFRGETLIDTLHSITRSEPLALTAAGGRLDPEARRLLDKCLAKERRARYQHADDLAVDLHRAAAESPPVGRVSEPPPTASASRSPWVVAALASTVALAGLYMAWSSAPASEVVRLSLPAAFRQAVTSRYHAISPDGRTVAYLSAETGGLVARALDSFEVRPILDSEGAVGPFFSPDGRRLAFFAGGRLMAVSLAGGAPREICDVAQNNSAGVWIGESMYFVQWATGTGVFRVPSEGGEPREVVPVSEGYGRLGVPRALPGGVGLAIQETDALGTEDSATRLVFFDGREPVRIDRPRVAYVDYQTALYVEAGTLFATAYDADSWQIEGDPIPLIEGVVDFAVSAAGTLAYRAGNAERISQLGRVDRTGSVQVMLPSDVEPARVQISPDGTQLLTGGNGIHVWDMERASHLSLTDQGLYPIWEPSGTSLVYASDSDEAKQFRRLRLDDPGATEVLRGLEIPGWPTGISPDGEQLLYYEIHPDTERDIWVLPLSGGDPFPYLVTPASERSAVFSPDGAWIAFMSDKDGRENVYIRPAPGRGGAETVVTPAGGREPRWSRDGRELYFRSGDGLWAVSVDASEGFSVGVPELLFEGRFAIEEGGRNQQYDVFPNGDFLMMFAPRGADELRVVVNWRSELEAALDRR